MKYDISVVIYAHNGAKTIERITKKLLAAENVSFEAIIVDDASEDETPAIVGQMSLEDGLNSKLKVISHIQEEGKLASWRSGLIASTAARVVCVDAQDVIDTQSFAVLLEQAEAAVAQIVVPTIRFSDDNTGETPHITRVAQPPSICLQSSNQILNGIFCEQTIEPRIGGWLFSKALLKRAFAEIDKEAYANLDEASVLFIAVTRAECLLATPAVCTILTQDEIAAAKRDIAMFEKLASKHSNCEQVEQYLVRSETIEQYKQAFEGFSLLLCKKACELFPTYVPAKKWSEAARALLTGWGAIEIGAAYATLPRTSLCETAIALAAGLDKKEDKHISNLCILLREQSKIKTALAFADKCTLNRIVVTYIVDEDMNVPASLPLAGKLPSTAFTKQRGLALEKALKKADADALVVYASSAQTAFDVLVARENNVATGLISERGHLTTRRIAEILPQAAFVCAAVSGSEVESELFNLINIDTTSTANLVVKMGSKAYGTARIAARKLVCGFARLAENHLQKSALLKRRMEQESERESEAEKQILALLSSLSATKKNLQEVERERDEYQAFFEGRVSKRHTKARIEDLRRRKEN